MSRIMMQLRGAARPLSFGGRGRPPLESSAGTAWSGLPFEVHRMSSVGEIGESGPLPGELGLMVVARGSYEITVRLPCGIVTSKASPGTMHLLSGDHRVHVLEVKGDAEVVAFHLTPEWLEYLPARSAELGRRGPIAGGRTASALVAAIREEVERGCRAGRLYAESLSLALLSYAFHGLPPAPRADGRFSAAERERLVDYVHDHLDQNLGVAALASLVDMSPRQFSSRFRATFGTSPHAYVMHARLRRGAQLLVAGRHEIADIALRVGFSSQSHFTSAFRRAFGETPRRYAKARRAVVTLV